jgi:hypothetical protein
MAQTTLSEELRNLILNMQLPFIINYNYYTYGTVLF